MTTPDTLAHPVCRGDEQATRDEGLPDPFDDEQEYVPDGE